MARYNFNVNTQSKLLDVHRQFRGGLKTVDTDDALMDFYLRQAENVSISEFGFLEKRYGLAKEESLITTNDTVQGHYYFKKGALTDEILIAGGKIYLKADGQTSFSPVNTFVKDSSFKYPATVSVSSTTEYPYTDDGHSASIGNNFDSNLGTFQTTRDVGAVRIKDNLFILTGSYPLIYTRNSIVDASTVSPTVYMMPYFIPDWTQIVSLNTGINLLVGDYDEAYGYDDLTILKNSTYKTGTEYITKNVQSTHAPLIPTTNFESSQIQLNLEARLDLEAPTDFYTTFSTFTNTSLEYQSVSSDSSVFFTEVEDDIQAGDACTAEGLFVKDSDGEYFQCVSSTSTGDYYNQIIPFSIKYRTSGSPDWLTMPDDNIVEYFIYTNANQSSTIGNNLNYLNITNPKVRYQTLASASGTAQSVPSLKVGLTGFPVGSFDFQITWSVESRYADGASLQARTLHSTFSTEYPGIQIVAEKVNADSLGFKPKALWTCNSVIEHYSKLMAWNSTEEPEYIFISHPEYHNWFPASATVKFDTDEDEPVKSVVPFMNVLIVQSETKTWGLKGKYIIPEYDEAAGTIDTTDLYAPFSISPIYGTIAPKSVRPVRNRLYFLSREGIVELTNLAFAFDEKYNVNELDRNIKSIVPRDVEAVAIQHDYQYWINFPSTGETLRYYVDKKAWVKDTYGKDENSSYSSNTFDFDGVFKYYSKDGVLSFITKTTQLDTGQNAAVFKVVVDKSLPSDFGKPFKSVFETANLNQGYPFHPKKYLESRMDFTLQNEYNTSKDAIAITSPVDEAAYVEFIAALKKGHQYQLGFAQNETITNVQYQLDNGSFTTTTFSYIGTLNPNTENEQVVNALYFDVPYQDFDEIKIKIIGSDISLTDAVLKDNTYDHTLNFNTWSISEEKTLNLDNVGYDVAESEIEINLGTVFGANETWVFDESDFGNKITAVKTVKLSGRGYNYKLFFTDRSRAKWTLESVGITFKFKRARSR